MATAKKKKKKVPNNLETRKKLENTPFSSIADLNKFSHEIRVKAWEQLERARIFNELSEKPDFAFIKEEFRQGLKCKYGADSKHLVKIYSEGKGVEVDINEDLVNEIPVSGQFVESLIRSLGDTFSKSYYQAKGILPPDAKIEDMIKAVQKANEKK